uniref:DUF1421 domain containing protein n=1 Tax=Caenorhabditis tropicalis TaxID=1561998 RepID=A0A1I7USH1_9PELO
MPDVRVVIDTVPDQLGYVWSIAPSYYAAFKTNVNTGVSDPLGYLMTSKTAETYMQNGALVYVSQKLCDAKKHAYKAPYDLPPEFYPESSDVPRSYSDRMVRIWRLSPGEERIPSPVMNPQEERFFPATWNDVPSGVEYRATPFGTNHRPDSNRYFFSDQGPLPTLFTPSPWFQRQDGTMEWVPQPFGPPHVNYNPRGYAYPSGPSFPAIPEEVYQEPSSNTENVAKKNQGSNEVGTEGGGFQENGQLPSEQQARRTEETPGATVSSESSRSMQTTQKTSELEIPSVPTTSQQGWLDVEAFLARQRAEQQDTSSSETRNSNLTGFSAAKRYTYETVYACQTRLEFVEPVKIDANGEIIFPRTYNTRDMYAFVRSPAVEEAFRTGHSNLFQLDTEFSNNAIVDILADVPVFSNEEINTARCITSTSSRKSVSVEHGAAPDAPDASDSSKELTASANAVPTVPSTSTAQVPPVSPKESLAIANAVPADLPTSTAQAASVSPKESVATAEALVATTPKDSLAPAQAAPVHSTNTARAVSPDMDGSMEIEGARRNPNFDYAEAARAKKAAARKRLRQNKKARNTAEKAAAEEAKQAAAQAAAQAAEAAKTHVDCLKEMLAVRDVVANEKKAFPVAMDNYVDMFSTARSKHFILRTAGYGNLCAVQKTIIDFYQSKAVFLAQFLATDKHMLTFVELQKADYYARNDWRMTMLFDELGRYQKESQLIQQDLVWINNLYGQADYQKSIEDYYKFVLHCVEVQPMTGFFGEADFESIRGFPDVKLEGLIEYFNRCLCYRSDERYVQPQWDQDVHSVLEKQFQKEYYNKESANHEWDYEKTQDFFKYWRSFFEKCRFPKMVGHICFLIALDSDTMGYDASKLSGIKRKSGGNLKILDAFYHYINAIFKTSYDPKELVIPPEYAEDAIE